MSDLNPVAVLINKAMIEIPPRFAGRPPVNPEFQGLDAEGAEVGLKTGKRWPGQARIGGAQWRGAQGLAEDVRYYGRWMREEAEKRIGHLYPKVEITPEMVRERPDLKPYEGRKLTVIAWLWARTVRSPNPAFADVEVPLVSTFMLSTKRGKEAHVEPVIKGRGYRFSVNAGVPPDLAVAKRGTKLSRGTFRCLMSGTPMSDDHIKAEGQAGRMRARLMAIVVEGDRARVYLRPTDEHEGASAEAGPGWLPEGDVPARLTGGTCVPYGLTTWADLFTPRQLVALTTFSDLVGEAIERVRRDGVAADLPDDGQPLRDGGTGAAAYAEAVGLYLAFALSKLADRGSTICTWFTERDSTRNTFARQSIPMTWDYAELNTLLRGTGSFLGAVKWTAESIEGLVAADSAARGIGSQGDAAKADGELRQSRGHGPALLRQHRLRRLVGFLLRLAAPVPKVLVSGSVRYSRRSEG